MAIIDDIIKALNNLGGQAKAIEIKNEVLSIWGGSHRYPSRKDFNDVIQGQINRHCQAASTFGGTAHLIKVNRGVYKLKPTPTKTSASKIVKPKVITPIVPTITKPEFEPKSGNIKRGETIEITCTTTLTDIFYTTDGSTIPNKKYEPNKGIQLYTDATITAIAYDKSGNKSKPNTEHYTVEKNVIDQEQKKNVIDQEKKKKIEKAAVDVVVKHYDSLGYETESVESENVGWDYNFYQKEEHLKVEIKGNSGKKINVELSPNEYSKMQMPEHINDYRVAIVTDALSDNPDLSIFKFKQNDLVFDSGLEKEISTSEPKSLKITEK